MMEVTGIRHMCLCDCKYEDGPKKLTKNTTEEFLGDENLDIE